jgi:protein SCO1/2
MASVVLTPAALAQPSAYSPEATFAYDQRLGTQVPGNLLFQDEQGREVCLGDYLGKRPIVLVLAQYRCPMLCNEVLNGLVDCLRGLPANAGEGFEVLVVSFDPREQPELAAAKKATYVGDYGRPGAEAGWHFLTGPQESIDPLTLAVGFQYAYSPERDRYAHPSGLVVLTPEGKVSAYLYGILYEADEMQRDLAAAAAGQVGAPVPTYRRVLLLCYDYDTATGSYSANVMKMVRAGGVLIVLILGIGVAVALVRERRAATRREREGRA